MIIQYLKSKLKLLVCHFILYSGILHCYIEFVYKRRRSFPLIIINYHGFFTNIDQLIDSGHSVSHRISDFRKELKFLRRYFKLISLDEAVQALKKNKQFDQPTITLTVDDGYKNNFEILFPVLKETNTPITIFLTAGLIGTKDRTWVSQMGDMILKASGESLKLNGLFSKQSFSLKSLADKRRTYAKILGKLKDLSNSDRNQYLKEIEHLLGGVTYDTPDMLNWDDARMMQKHNVFFGAHTCNHPILTNIPLEEAKKEILDSKKMIEKELGVPVKHFAYPNGRPRDFNEELRQYCKEIGLESIATCDYGHNHRPDDIWALKRIGPPLPVSIYAFNIFRALLKRGS